MREISMWASAVRSLSATGWPSAGTCSFISSSFLRQISAIARWSCAASMRAGNAPSSGATQSISRLSPGARVKR